MLSEVKKLYLTHRERSKSASTLVCDRQSLNRLGRWLQDEDVSVDALLEKDFRTFPDFLMGAAGLCREAARTRVRFLKYFFAFLKESGYADHVPVLTYPAALPEQRLRSANEPFSDEELRGLFNAVIAHKPNKKRDRKTLLALTFMILVFLYSGMKKDELLVLTTDDIDLEDGAGFPRQAIPMHTRLIELGFLAYVANHTGRIFPRNESNYRRKFAEIVEKAGIKTALRHKTFQSCKATFETALAGAAASLVTTLTGSSTAGKQPVSLKRPNRSLPLSKDALQRVDYHLDFEKLDHFLRCEMSELYP